MAKCDYCGTTILFGGKRQGELRFCNATCSGRGTLLAISKQVPEYLVNETVMKVHQGLCPKCGGAGPVDVHVRHQVWSALVLTSWKSVPQISCRGCGVKSQLGGAAFSLVAGWWGFPWGLLFTPVQVGRNVFGMLRGPDPLNPSRSLEKAIRMNIAAQAVSRQRTTGATASAGPPLN
jgi:hypothetical protein